MSSGAIAGSPDGHRRDIDGLRALAIVPVVLFHVGTPGFSGGFVGVDVFFVISGFLITGILQRSLEAERFSLAGFYARRARRILPALAVMAAVTALAALALMTPEDLLALGRDLAATALFVSNLQFTREIGYFSPNAATMPLLHTWSLAIEEQFYAAWPLILWATYRFARRALPAVVVGLGLGSFALSIWWTRDNPADAFFMTPTRVWELMLGAQLVLWPVIFARRWLRELMSDAGLALIALSIVTFNTGTASPGPMAALPCLGAALCLAANGQGDTLVARLLSWRPVVFVGLISYSLYLWHWPLLALATYRLLEPPSAAQAAAIIGLSLVLAVLSWRFIEQPFRRGGLTAPRRTLALAAAAIAILALAGGTMVLTRGLPGRVDAGVRIADAARYDRSPFGACGPPPAPPRCRIGPPGPEEIAVWGDSHAVAFTPVIVRDAARADLRVRLYTRGACPPLLGVSPVRPGHRIGGCAESNRRAMAAMAANPSLRTVVLVSRWTTYAESEPIGQDGRVPMFLIDEADATLARSNSRRAFAAALERTILALRAALGPDGRIILVEQPPELVWSVPDCFSRRRMWGLSTGPCDGIDRAVVDRRQAFVRAQLRAAAARYPGVSVYSLPQRMCRGDRCLTRSGETFLYTDDDHLSRAGGLAVAGDFSLAPETRDSALQTGKTRP